MTVILQDTIQLWAAAEDGHQLHKQILFAAYYKHRRMHATVAADPSCFAAYRVFCRKPNGWPQALYYRVYVGGEQAETGNGG